MNGPVWVIPCVCVCVLSRAQGDAVRWFVKPGKNHRRAFPPVAFVVACGSTVRARARTRARAKINTARSLRASRGQRRGFFRDRFYLRRAKGDCPCRALYPCKLIVIGRYVAGRLGNHRVRRVEIAADFYFASAATR